MSRWPCGWLLDGVVALPPMGTHSGGLVPPWVGCPPPPPPSVRPSCGPACVSLGRFGSIWVPPGSLWVALGPFRSLSVALACPGPACQEARALPRHPSKERGGRGATSNPLDSPPLQTRMISVCEGHDGLGFAIALSPREHSVSHVTHRVTFFG